MPKKIFITRKIADKGLKMLQEKGYEIDIWPKDSAPSKKEIIKTLRKKSYDAVICLLTDSIDAEVFDSAPSVKIYANYADGFNNINIDEARKRQITITNTPGVSSLAVAEHAVVLALALSTRIVEADTYTRKGKYKGWAPNTFVGNDLSGKTFGLIGVGHIGAKTASIMNRGFGAKIIYFDPTPNTEIEKTFGAVRKNTIEELLTEADFVSLHVPLMDSTRHLINEARLRMMKPTAFIINTARGPIIDEKALVTALKNGIIAGAGLDVYEFEPKLTKGLAKMPNVVLTPHIASSRQSVRNGMSEICAKNVIEFLETGKVTNNLAS